jgi:hypothetical protein
MILRGLIVVLNVHAPIEDKTDDIEDPFNEELERVLGKFTKDHMKMLLGDLNIKIFFNWYRGGWSPIGSTRHCGH